MAEKLTPRQIVRHPVASWSIVFSTLSLVFHIHSLDVLMGFLWSNAAQLSTVTGIFGFTVLPEIQLPVVTMPVVGWQLDLAVLGTGMKILAIAFLLMYGFKILLGLFNGLRDKLTYS